jgi:LPXTG-motif cell wall-anchored protein
VQALHRAPRFCAVVLMLTVATVVGGSTAAHAAVNPVDVNTTCSGRFIENDGSTGAEVPPGIPFPLPTSAPPIGGATEVNAGASFSATGTSVTIPIPAQVDTKIKGNGIGIEGEGVVNVSAASQIVETIEVTGAASVGTPTINGGNVIGASVAKDGAQRIVLTFPGTKPTDDANFRVPPANTSFVPGNENQFVPGGSFQSPKLTIPVTAGAAGSTIQFKLVKFQADSDVDAFDNFGHIFVRAFCTPDANLLGAVQVVTPPPPGAPDAVADVVQTDEGESVNVAVLANDKPNAVLAIDEDSLTVTKAPGHGTATVNEDRTITYTPAAGFSGGDEFTYRLCSVPEQPPAVEAAAVVAPCDTAKVTITVIAATDTVDVPQTTPTSAAPATTVAAAAELPRTGSSTAPLTAVALASLAAGAVMLYGIRRRTA